MTYDSSFAYQQKEKPRFRGLLINYVSFDPSCSSYP